MKINQDKFSYYLGLTIMAIRGTIYQLLRLRFRGLLLLETGGKIYGLGNLQFFGVLKVGRYAVLDVRFCVEAVVGNRFSLGDFSILRASGSSKFISPYIRIGSGVTFGPYSNIGGGYGLDIGDNCLFGPYVSIHPEEHIFSDIIIPVRSQGIRGLGIKIETNNWFGAKSTVLDGAMISSGCIFGAGSLIKSGVYPKNIIYAGVPVKKIKYRDTQ